jgi:hypothetical protein
MIKSSPDGADGQGHFLGEDESVRQMMTVEGRTVADDHLLTPHLPNGEEVIDDGGLKQPPGLGQ